MEWAVNKKWAVLGAAMQSEEFGTLRWESFHREREAETHAEGEAASLQGARRGTQYRVSRITPQAEAVLNR